MFILRQTNHVLVKKGDNFKKKNKKIKHHNLCC